MRCPKCNGAKKISDLGFVKKQCPECLGVGHVKDDLPPITRAEDCGTQNEMFPPEKKSRNASKIPPEAIL